MWYCWIMPSDQWKRTKIFKPLWPSDTIYWHRSSWLIIKGVQQLSYLRALSQEEVFMSNPWHVCVCIHVTQSYWTQCWGPVRLMKWTWYNFYFSNANIVGWSLYVGKYSPQTGIISESVWTRLSPPPKYTQCHRVFCVKYIPATNPMWIIVCVCVFCVDCVVSVPPMILIV